MSQKFDQLSPQQQQAVVSKAERLMQEAQSRDPGERDKTIESLANAGSDYIDSLVEEYQKTSSSRDTDHSRSWVIMSDKSTPMNSGPKSVS